LIDNSDIYRLSFVDVNASDIGIYQATVKGTCGSEMSSKTYLYVRKEKTPENPEIFIWPTVTDGVINAALSTDEIYSIRIFSYTGQLIRDLNDCRYRLSLIWIIIRGDFILSGSITGISGGPRNS